MARFAIPGQQSGRAPERPPERNGLEHATESLRARGNYPGQVRRTSLYAEASTRPLVTATAIASTFLLLRSAWRSLPHRAARFDGRKGSRANAKGLHIELEARRGRVPELMDLISDLRGAVEVEPNTRPWFGLRRNKRQFEIFETFPNETARKRHLSGPGAAELLARSNHLLKRPARITRLDVVEAKTDAL